MISNIKTVGTVATENNLRLYLCSICSRNILYGCIENGGIVCIDCSKSFHKPFKCKCHNITNKYSEKKFAFNNKTSYCEYCISEALPKDKYNNTYSIFKIRDEFKITSLYTCNICRIFDIYMYKFASDMICFKCVKEYKIRGNTSIKITDKEFKFIYNGGKCNLYKCRNGNCSSIEKYKTNLKNLMNDFNRNFTDYDFKYNYEFEYYLEKIKPSSIQIKYVNKYKKLIEQSLSEYVIIYNKHYLCEQCIETVLPKKITETFRGSYVKITTKDSRGNIYVGKKEKIISTINLESDSN